MSIILQMKQSVILVLTSLLTVQTNPVMTRLKAIQQMTQEQMCAKMITVNNVHYIQGEVINISGVPADLSVHWKTGIVFFTLISEEMRMSLQVLHTNGDLDTVKVAGLGQSTAVDNLNDIVYLATDNGVYKYKPDGSIELYTALGEDVMYVTVSSDGNTMYIATWPQNRVHKITNGGQKTETFSAVPNGHGLTLDTMNNIYFVASKTSYILKAGTTIPIKIKGLPSDKMTGIFLSKSDQVFAMDENSNLFIIDPDNASANHVGSFNVQGVNTFGLDSSENVILGVKGSIMKFMALKKSPCPEFTKTNVVQRQRDYGHIRQPTVREITTKITTTEPYDDDDEESTESTYK